MSMHLAPRSDVRAAAAACAAAVLDSPAARAQPGELEVVAEAIRRLADALETRASADEQTALPHGALIALTPSHPTASYAHTEYGKTLRQTEAEAEEAEARAAKARARALSGVQLGAAGGGKGGGAATPADAMAREP